VAEPSLAALREARAGPLSIKHEPSAKIVHEPHQRPEFAADDGVAMRPAGGTYAAGPGLASIRPERIRMHRAAPDERAAPVNAALGTLAAMSYRAATRVCIVTLAGGRSVTITESGDRGADEIPPGAGVRLEWDGASIAALRED